mgnify:CR=1 FL=1
MMEKIKLSEVEKGLPNGIIAQIRGLEHPGRGHFRTVGFFFE